MKNTAIEINLLFKLLFLNSRFVRPHLAKFERLPLVYPHRYGLYTKDANSVASSAIVK